MTSLATALRTYPTNYTIERDLKAENNKSNHSLTHINKCADILDRVSKLFMLPGEFNAQMLAKVIEPHAGKNKHQVLSGIIIRIVSFALFLISLPFAVFTVPIGMVLRAIEHTYRPAMCYTDNSGTKEAKAKKISELELSKEKPFTIRTHNVGFVTTSMSTTGDLRHPVERARELVNSINNDPAKPDVIFFQETFHKDASKILREGIKNEYPYIIDNIAPQISGFNSGSMVASKYPISHSKFNRFAHMLPPESMSPRGVTRIVLESPKGPLLLYGVHTQALLGERRAIARYMQLIHLKHLMEKDKETYTNAMQIVCGDFNTSRINAWGEDNIDPRNQAEAQTLQRMDDFFDDVYLRDHVDRNGARTYGEPEPIYLKIDNLRLGLAENALQEPRGTWFHGPFADPGCLLNGKMRYDRWKHNRDNPKPLEGLFKQKCTWGTPEWHTDQTANTARFDYILLPKNQKSLDGRAEIRRPWVPKGSQSSSSDHLPVDGRFWLNTLAQPLPLL